MALKSIDPTIEIIGIGRNADRLEIAKRKRAVDDYSCDPGGIHPKLDALVVCTPVRLVPEMIEVTATSLRPQAVITDVGSTKKTVVEQSEAAVKNGYFIGSHPMAGSHETGIEAAVVDLFQDKICVVTPTERSNPEAKRAVIALWRAIGMKVVELPPDVHDRLTAHSSHLPHLVAAALCHVASRFGDRIVPVLGNGFRDTTRIAEGHPDIWLDICIENRFEIIRSIESLQSVLAQLTNALDEADEKAVLEFLSLARDWKSNTLAS